MCTTAGPAATIGPADAWPIIIGVVAIGIVVVVIGIVAAVKIRRTKP